jgi:predicted ATPase
MRAWPAHSLPPQLTDFVGREAELADVARRLAAGARLVTLTGAGGSGKTRLALEVAGRARPDFAGGERFVDLAPLADPALVPQALATSLGVPEEPDRPLVETVIRALSGWPRLLLLLDNCEHLMEACVRAADALLRACPGLHLLATSREPLGIEGEEVWPVPPLSLPPVDAVTPEGMLPSDAVGLFIRRGRAAQPRFALTERNAAAVARLCHRLDGLPLAIELAAARLRALSVAEILERLDDRFRLLTGGSRTAPPRQQTLLATVAWSYDLLADQERALFERLSVFAGGCTLEGAEAVCADPPGGAAPEEAPGMPTPSPESAGPPGSLPLARDDVLDLLARLVDKSLVVAEEDAEDRTRYRLPETLRQYGAARLVARGHVDVLRHRHAAYFATSAEAVEPHLEGPDQGRWFDRQQREYDNCRAALRWAVDHPDLDTGECALRLAAALWRFWWIRGYRHEARAWREAVLGLPARPVRSAAWAKVAILTSLVSHGKLDRFEEALGILRERGQRRDVVAALAWHALWLRFRGDSAAAVAAAVAGAVKGLAQFGRADDPQSAATLLYSLAGVAVDQRDYAVARQCYEESLALYRTAGNRDRTAAALNSLGHVARAGGDLAGSRALHEEAFDVWHELGYANGLSGALRGLGAVALAEGDYAQARTLLEVGAARAREGDIPGQEARVLVSLALLARATGDAGGARAHLDAARAIWRDDGLEHHLAPTLEEFAFLAAAHGHAERALRAAGAAAALRETTAFRLNAAGTEYVRRQLAPAYRALDGEAAAGALAAGRHLNLEQAIDEVLDWAPLGSAEGGAPSARSVAPSWAAGAGAAVGPADLGRLHVDARTYEVRRGAHPLAARLSAQEFALLAYLYERSDRVCTRRELGDATWGTHNWEPTMLYRLVRRLRQKLEPDPGRPRYLHTVPGIGYRLTAGA